MVASFHQLCRSDSASREVSLSGVASDARCASEAMVELCCCEILGDSRCSWPGIGRALEMGNDVLRVGREQLIVVFCALLRLCCRAHASRLSHLTREMGTRQLVRVDHGVGQRYQV